MTWLSHDAVARLRDVASLPELPAGRYELLGPLGRGGMGAVYTARDQLLDREVALKVSIAVDASSDLDRRLRDEARILARLEHPGIVPVHDAGRLVDGRVFYVMKLVRGETLEGHRDRLTTQAAGLAVFERVSETVAFAHAAGVLHRDLKPANVMVGSFGEVLVLDWGVARTLTSRADVTAGPGGPGDQAGGPQTEAGTRIGTPGFMAPEQAAGDVIGPPADVYALGALLVWLLSGRVPASTDQAATILQRVNPAPSRRLTAIALKALDPNPAVRYPTAGGLLDDLARYRAGAAVTAHREHVFERAGRWLYTYRTFVLLVLAYLIMRTLFAFWSRG